MNSRLRKKKRLGSPSCRLLLSLFLAVGICLFMLCVQGLNDRVFPAEAALVLGDERATKEGISGAMQAKVNTACGLYYYGTVKKIIVSVVESGNGPEVAEALHEYMVKYGVPTSDIIITHTGSDTRGTSKFTAAYLNQRGWQRVIAVGQFFQLPRAVLSLKHEGVQVVGSLHVNYFDPSDVLMLLREIPAYFAYWSETK